MKKFFISLALLLTVAGATLGSTHTITNIGLSFSPSTLNVEEGDTIIFSIESIHQVREVSQATWNANGNTGFPGGFSTPFGGGTVVITGVGVHYYVCVPHSVSGMKGTITVSPLTDVQPTEAPLPAKFFLEQNYPNPFNPSTTLKFSVGAAAFTEVVIYSSDGRRVKTLVSEYLAPGTFTASWDGTDDHGLQSASDLYFVRMLSGAGTGAFRSTRKLLLIR